VGERFVSDTSKCDADRSLTILGLLDRLLNNPWAQPPLASDWEVHPTYPKHTVPYYLAPLWDQDMAARAGAEKQKRETARKQAQASDEGAGKIPRELREKLKKAKAARGLLKDLEEQVRVFVKSWEDSSKKEAKAENPEIDSEDEEIVFVGRNGQMSDMPPSPKSKDRKKEDEIERDRLVFDSLANDQGASFGYVICISLSLPSSVLISSDAGWFTQSLPTTVYTPGRSRWETQRDGRPMWVSHPPWESVDHHRQCYELVPCGAWFDYLVSQGAVARYCITFPCCTLKHFRTAATFLCSIYIGVSTRERTLVYLHASISSIIIQALRRPSSYDLSSYTDRQRYRGLRTLLQSIYTRICNG